MRVKVCYKIAPKADTNLREWDADLERAIACVLLGWAKPFGWLTRGMGWYTELRLPDRMFEDTRHALRVSFGGVVKLVKA